MRYIAMIAVLAAALIGPAPSYAASDDKTNNIVNALNGYMDCLTTNALALGKHSHESAEVLVRAAKTKCKLKYLDAAAAYAESGILDVPASAQKTIEDHAIAAIIEKRSS